MTKLMPCECKSVVQDTLYGKGIRVFNDGKGPNKDTTAWRCTVCVREVVMDTVGVKAK